MTQRHDWKQPQLAELYEQPFCDLLYKAREVHQEHFNPRKVQLSTLISVKTGTCPEDCSYCPQSGHYKTGVERQTMMDLDDVVEKAKQAKANGATRFCMGAAWRSPPKRDFPKVLAMVVAIKNLGLETCVTAGTLDDEQAEALKEAGLDYYNHNLDTSPEFYKTIITTHTYQDRLATLGRVMQAGIKTCCGGIIGMGETREDRIQFLMQLANLPKHPESVPINRLIPIKGTPLESTPPIDNFEFIRTIAIARIIMPTSVVRLSAGRENMSEEMQTLCFLAGANSIFFGERLLTAGNPECDADLALLSKLGMETT